jgi:hypothetical protein
MTKIVVSLCSILIFYMTALNLAVGKLCIRKATKKELADAFLIKSIEYLNFSHFSHF